MSLQFWGLEQWRLHTSLTNIKAVATGERRGRWWVVHVQFKSGTRAFSLPGCSAAYTTGSVWLSDTHRMQNKKILWAPSPSSKDRKTVMKRKDRLLADLLGFHSFFIFFLNHGWQREECEKEWWRTLNLLSFSITQWCSVATAFKETDGDKNPCLTL